MRRWLIPLIAALMLLSGQTVLAAQPQQGVVRDLADANNARCHNPEGITASPEGLLYAAGLSGNICIYDLSGNELGHLIVAPNHALLGELYTPEGIYVADNNPGFTGGRLIRVDPETGAFVVLAEGFGAPNAIAQDHSGTLYVSDSFAGAIYTVSPNGGGKTLWRADPQLQPQGSPPFGANGVAFDRTQSWLYVANTSDDKIFRIRVSDDPTERTIQLFADGATLGPTGTTPATTRSTSQRARSSTSGVSTSRISRWGRRPAGARFLSWEFLSREQLAAANGYCGAIARHSVDRAASHSSVTPGGP